MRRYRALIAALALVALAVNACAVVRSSERVKVALFAPFEGRYREIGYNALYAARLALRENPRAQVDLLAVDDGGTEAVNRARALALDPLVMGVIALGYDATTPEVLLAFGDDLPVMIVGEWGAEPVGENVFILSNPEIASEINTPPRVSVTDAAALPAPLVGSDVLALEGFAKMRESLDGVTVLSSGVLPDESLLTENYSARYKGDDPFAPEPGLLAYQTTTAMSIAAYVYTLGSPSRSDLIDYLRYNSTAGYLNIAKVYRYEYVDGSLTEDAVE